MKILIYTAIFGDKDSVPQVLNYRTDSGLDIDFICLTDNALLKSDLYEMIVVSRQFTDLAKNARYYKLNGPTTILNYDVAIWHDSSIWLDFQKLPELTEFAAQNMVSVFHHKRYCLYREAIACLDNGKDSALKILFQTFRYYWAGVPALNKLHETGIMVSDVRRFFGSELQTVWWNEVKNWTRRDQLALTYARWKTHTEVGLLEGETGEGANNRFSIWKGHQKPDHINQGILNSGFIRKVSKKLILEMRRRR